MLMLARSRSLQPIKGEVAMKNYPGVCLLVLCAFIVQLSANITGRAVDENGNGIFVKSLEVYTYLKGSSGPDGRFSVNVDDLFPAGVKTTRLLAPQVSHEEERVFSLNGACLGKTRSLRQASRGVYLVARGREIVKSAIFSSARPTFIRGNEKDLSLAKRADAFPFPLTLIFSDSCHQNKMISLTGRDMALGDVVCSFLRVGEISPLQKDSLSYFISARMYGFALPQLYRNGVPVPWLERRDDRDTFSVIRIFESGSYRAYFPGFPCKNDTVSFTIVQPKITRKLVLNPEKDQSGFGKVLRPNVLDGMKINLWQLLHRNLAGDTVDVWRELNFKKELSVKETSRLRGYFSAPFMDNSDTLEEDVLVAENEINPNYNSFSVGNPDGKSVVVIVAKEFAELLSFDLDISVYGRTEYYFNQLVFSDLAAERFADIDFVKADGTLMPREKVSLETCNLQVIALKSRSGFLQSLYDLPVNRKIEVLQFHAHGTPRYISFPGDTVGFSWKDVLAFPADTMAVITGKFAPGCLGYATSCSIAAKDTIDPKEGIAKVLANVFKIPFYASSSLVSAGYLYGKMTGEYGLVLPDK